MAEGITEILRSMQDDRREGITYNRRETRTPGYRHNWNLTIDGVDQSPVLISAETYWRNMSAFRLEWNPRHYRNRTARLLWNRLLDILSINFDDFLCSASVTRLDLAVDVCPMKPYSILVEATGLSVQNAIYGCGGRLQYLKLGFRGGDFSYYIYDKDPENGNMISRIPNTTRIEARLRPQVSLFDLPTLESPFSRLNIYGSVHPATLNSVNVRQRINFTLAQQIGLQPVMRLLGRPANTRSFRRFLGNELSTDWFSANEIWTGYPAALAQLQVPRDTDHAQAYLNIPAPRRRRRRTVRN